MLAQIFKSADAAGPAPFPLPGPYLREIDFTTLADLLRFISFVALFEPNGDAGL